MRTPRIMGQDRWRKHAVLIPLIKNAEKDGYGYDVLLEVRSAKLRRQPGEICFPGGRIEQGEQPLEAAMRETQEELCIEKSRLTVLETLDIYVSNAGLAVYVFLGEISGYAGTFSADEVEAVFRVPFSYFAQHPPKTYQNPLTVTLAADFPSEKIPGGKNYPWQTGRHEVNFYEYGGHVIWGMTAKIMKESVELIKACIAADGACPNSHSQGACQNTGKR